MIETLRKDAQERCTFHEARYSAPPGWITSADVEQFEKLVDAKDPAAHLGSAELYGSCLSFFQMSTVGQETRFMIEGYNKGKYPPALTSDSSKE